MRPGRAGFLKVIGGQPVVVRADEVFEKEPGAAGQAAQGSLLLCREGLGQMTEGWQMR